MEGEEAKGAEREIEVREGCYEAAEDWAGNSFRFPFTDPGVYSDIPVVDGCFDTVRSARDDTWQYQEPDHYNKLSLGFSPSLPEIPSVGGGTQHRTLFHPIRTESVRLHQFVPPIFPPLEKIDQNSRTNEDSSSQLVQASIENTDEWQILKHTTISKDRTAQSNFHRKLLVTLEACQDFSQRKDSGQNHIGQFVPATLEDYQMQLMLLEQQ